MIEEMPDGSRVVRISKLRLAILASGYPAYYVGAQAGIHHSTTSQYVTGQKPIKVAHLATLSRVLDKPADELVGWSYFRVSTEGDIEEVDPADL